MRARKALNILHDRFEISSPCSENWDEMPREGMKRYCEKCQHSVVDFSELTPKEALKLWKQKSR